MQMGNYDAQESGGRIRLLRRQMGMTQAALAERAGVSIDTVKRMERGGGGSIDVLLAVAEVGGVSLDYLVCGEEKDSDGVLDGIDQEDRQVLRRVLFAAAKGMKQK